MPDQYTPAEKIHAGLERIMAAITIESTIVNLSDLNLTDEELRPLLRRCQACPNLKHLDLSGNRITALPKEIEKLRTLTSLSLEKNQLKYFPQRLRKLPNLAVLRAGSNRFKTVPDDIARFSALEKLTLSGNPITRLSGKLGALPNLKSLEFDFSQLAILSDQIGRLPYSSCASESTAQIRPTITGGGHIHINFVQGQMLDLIWTDTFGQYKEGVLRAAEMLKLTDSSFFYDLINPVTFKDAAGSELLPDQVLAGFMGGLANLDPGSLTKIYLPALKKFLTPLFDKKTSITDRKSILQTLATSLGNCSTPKKDLLIQIYIGQQLESKPYEKLKLLNQRMIEREAVEQLLRKKADEWIYQNPELSEENRTELVNERSELINGLSNMIYGTKNRDITAERESCPLSSKTRNTQYADELAQMLLMPFMLEFCQKDERGGLIYADEGWSASGKLDEKKIDAITADFLQSRGHGTEKSGLISALAADYESSVREIMLEKGFFDIHDGKTEVNEMLNNIAIQTDELKKMLWAAENMQETFEHFLNKDKATIIHLAAVLERPTQHNLTAPPDQLAELAITPTADSLQRAALSKAELSRNARLRVSQNRVRTL